MEAVKKKIPLVVVAGPTAAGKTRLAADLALLYGGEVVSADSMQLYKYMDIGTAKPTSDEMKGVPHHLIGIAEPSQVFSAPRYARLAHAAIADIHARGRLPVLVGGTGLYIRAVVDNVEFPAMPDAPALREELSALSGEELLDMLREIDPALAAALHPNNKRRIVRAVEVYRLTGVPMSRHHELSHVEPSPYEACMLGVAYSNRALLYRRIEERVDEMMAAGLLEETRGLLQRGFSLSSFQAIGYKELLDYIEGKTGLEEAVDNIKRQTRRYAKRQLTWFMRDERIHWLYPDLAGSYEAVLSQAREILEESGIL